MSSDFSLLPFGFLEFEGGSAKIIIFVTLEDRGIEGGFAKICLRTQYPNIGVYAEIK